MASFALTSLLPLLKKMKIDIDALSVSKENPSLFKDILQLLKDENPDRKLVDALIGNIETKESYKLSGKPLPDMKKNPPEPLLSETKEVPVAFIPKKKTTKKPMPLFFADRLPVAENAKDPVVVEKEKEKSFVIIEYGKKTGSKPNEGLLNSRYISHNFLKQNFEETKAVHTIRSSKTLKELIHHADTFGLNPTEFKISVKEKPLVISDKKSEATRPSHSISIPQRSEPVFSSNHDMPIKELETAGSEFEGKKRGETKVAYTQNNITSELQKLLTETKTKKETKPQPSTKEKREILQKENFISVFSDLQKVIKNSKHTAKNVEPGFKISMEPMKSESESIYFESSPTDNVTHTETKGKTAEHLTQKIIDARSTIRHFATNLKEQIENYKPPFTRIQLSLDPKELGSVEVTLVSRGNNLHIQVNSNPAAIGIMAPHGNELKNQLVSMGFTDIQMQFNMNQQQQERQRRQDFGSKFKADTQDIPDFYESLDLIIPQYV